MKFILILQKNFEKRDYKNLYKSISENKIKNVVGIDLPFKRPEGCSLYLSNNGSKNELFKNYKKILNLIEKRKIKVY